MRFAPLFFTLFFDLMVDGFWIQIWAAISMFWQLLGTFSASFSPKCNVNAFWSISVACGNSSAPGPKEDNLHAKNLQEI